MATVTAWAGTTRYLLHRDVVGAPCSVDPFVLFPYEHLEGDGGRRLAGTSVDFEIFSRIWVETVSVARC